MPGKLVQFRIFMGKLERRITPAIANNAKMNDVYTCDHMKIYSQVPF